MLDVPVLTDAEEEILRHPEDRYPADAGFEALDAEQFLQGELVARELAWVDARELTGGDD